MLTGDSRRPALAVARQLGIGEDDVFPRVRPEGKLQRIQRAAGCGTGRGHGGRRGQRRGRPGPGRPGHRDRHRHRRGHRRGRPDAGRRGSAADRRRHPAVAGGAADDPRQPRLGVRVQPRRAPAGRARLSQPPVRRPGHGVQLADRRVQQPAPTAPARRAPDPLAPGPSRAAPWPARPPCPWRAPRSARPPRVPCDDRRGPLGGRANRVRRGADRDCCPRGSPPAAGGRCAGCR